MSDLNHTFGQDLTPTTAGDIGVVSGIEMGRQRVLRRLLTNPGEYIFHKDYGAGLGQLVGSVFDAAKIRARVRAQMVLESCVSKAPEPQVTVTAIQNGVQCDIRYTDSQSGQTVGLSFNVTK